MSTRVFIVEDSPLIYERIVEDISGLDDVEICGHAEREDEAISEVEKAAPDVALVDVNLQQGNGLNVTRAIRKKLPHSRVRIIIMTNFASPILRRQSLALGADDFIDKSTEFERIPEILLAMAKTGPGSSLHSH
jgi:two-component system, OmpR family, response regulator